MRQVNPDTAGRYREVVRLRMVGLTFDDIADQVGYSDRSGAKRAYDMALERWHVETVEQQRVLDQVDRALRIEKRRSELWGLDAPRQHEITGLHGGAIRTDIGDLLLAKLQELRDEQGPLALPEVEVVPFPDNGQGPE